jgi:2-phosphosulfolactate phosphatase
VAGERNARPQPGFDFGNSPHDILRADVAGRTLVHTTHSGTQGLVRCAQADEVLTGSLVNAAALVRYVRQRQPAEVTIVRMGYQARERCAEDDACAAILAARLQGVAVDEAALIAALADAPAAAKFRDPAATYAPFEDLALCLMLDRFDFVLRRSAPDAGGLCFLERVDV